MLSMAKASPVHWLAMAKTEVCVVATKQTLRAPGSYVDGCVAVPRARPGRNPPQALSQGQHSYRHETRGSNACEVKPRGPTRVVLSKTSFLSLPSQLQPN